MPLGYLLALALIALAATAPDTRPPAEPAKIRLSVVPAAVAPGGRAELKLDLTAAPGVKINRYPKVKLSLAPRAGVVQGGDASLGNDAPPPLDEAGSNYFGETIDPLRLPLAVEATAEPGQHELDATVTYFYCVAASGFCAPSRTAIKVPIEIR